MSGWGYEVTSYGKEHVSTARIQSPGRDNSSKQMLPTGDSEYLNLRPKIRQRDHDETILAQRSNSHKELRLYLQIEMIWALAEMLLFNVFFHGKSETCLCEGEKDPLKGSPANTRNICGVSPLQC